MNNIIEKIYLRTKKLPLAYDGSKKKIFKWIAPQIIKNLKNADIVLDGFSGTGIISAFLSLNDYQVYATDSLYSSYILTSTLNQNPGVILSEDEINYLSSHRCIDGIVFENDVEVEDVDDYVYKTHPGILTKNEVLWLSHLNKKIQNLDLFKKQIAQCAIRGISTIIPFSTSNGTKKFQNRIKQKDKYKQRCLGFYYNSSYEIEYIKWFQKYAQAFNDSVSFFSENRKYDVKVYHDDIFNILNLNIDFDAAYLDPPYGRKNSIGYNKMYLFQENLLNAPKIDYKSFEDPINHKNNFYKLLDACSNIKTLIFSYDNNSWDSIDNICLILKKFGRIIDIISIDHCHGKIPMDSHNKKVIENIIIAIK